MLNIQYHVFIESVSINEKVYTLKELEEKEKSQLEIEILKTLKHVIYKDKVRLGEIKPEDQTFWEQN